MRHFYKPHGKHCYLRSFQMKCPKCGVDVLYWECRHGSKVFFEYPPYGKLIRHFCRQLKDRRKSRQVIVKKPKGLLENPSPSCPVCGKLFKSEKNLKEHLKQLRKSDYLHKQSGFFRNEITFKKNFNTNNKIKNEEKKNSYKPKFGRINIKKRNK